MEKDIKRPILQIVKGLYLQYYGLNGAPHFTIAPWNAIAVHGEKTQKEYVEAFKRSSIYGLFDPFEIDLYFVETDDKE